MIRVGTEEDVEALIELAREFWTHSGYDEPFCEDSCYNMMSMCLDHKLMAVLEIDGVLEGFACGIVSVLMCTESAIVGTELAWWVSPRRRVGSNGVKLLHKLENLARDAGVKYWNMAYLESSMPARIEGLYQRLGYKKTETAYQKILS